MKKNKAKQMLLSLGLMATVASPLVTVISCGESDGTAPKITVDQKTILDGETVQGSGTEYTLSLTQGTTVTQEAIEGLFTVEDDMDEDVTLTYTWETGTFEAATTGECVLTISSEDAAGNSVTYTLTITVSPPEVEGAEIEVVATDEQPTIAVDTETAADSGDANSVVSDNGDGTGTMTLTTGSGATKDSVQNLFSASDTEDGDLTASLSFSWDTELNTSQAGDYKLTVEVTDSASQTVTYVLTVTVADAIAAEPEVEVVATADAQPTIAVDTETAADSGDANSVVSDNSDGTGTLTLTTGSGATEGSVQNLFSASDTEDGDLTASLSFSWDTALNTSQAGDYKLTVTVIDSASQTVTYVLTVTVADAIAAEPEVEVVATADAQPTIAVDTETAADSGDANSVVSDNSDGTGTLTLTTGSGATEGSVQNLFSASDTEDGDLTASLSFSWDTALNTSQAGDYKLTVEVTDSASQTVTYVLTVTVADAIAAEPEVEVVATADAQPTIAVDTETAADSGDANSVVSDNSDGTGTLTLTTGSGATEGSVQNLFSASDTEDGDLTASLSFSWDTALNTSQAGDYKLTVTVIDSASHTLTYVLTVTVTKHAPGGAGSGTGETGSSGSGGGETLDMADAELKELVTFTGSDGSGTYSVTDVAGDGYKITLDESASDSTSGSLSNGDKLTFTVSAEAGYTLGTTPETFTVIVSGLDPVATTLDMADAELKELVTFTGSDGSGTYSVTDVAGDGYKITLDESASDSTSGSLSNGDKLTFTVSAEAGYTLGTTSETFTVIVSGLDPVATTLDMADAELKELVTFTGSDGSGTYSVTDVAGDGYKITLDESASDSTSGSLSNGDKLTFTVSAEAGYTLGTTPETFTVIVSGLDPVATTLDMADAELKELVTFTGSDGSGTYSVTDVAGDGYKITLDESASDSTSGSLSNGDKLTFTVSAEAGYTLGTTPETFTVIVSGLDPVATTLDMADAELKELVTFTGSDGSGTYSVTDVAGDGYKITLDESASDSTSGSLSNGDKLTFTVSAEAGYTLGTTPETFTVIVSGLDPVAKTL